MSAGVDPVRLECPACGAASGEWCSRHGQTQPGHTLVCVARSRAAARFSAETRARAAMFEDLERLGVL